LIGKHVLPEICTDPGLGCRLARYELRLLSEDDELAFECHLLECDACFNALVEGKDFMPQLASLISHRREARNPVSESGE
jgi:hypothetical protein